MQDQDKAKQAAAIAGARLVERDMVIGLGTGSTAALLVNALGSRVREEGLRFVAVATSEATEEQARGHGIRIIPARPHLDLAIDGADEVELGTLDLIKGLGGALLREKVVAQAARRFVVIADDSKLVERLGMSAPLPVEVTKFGHENVAARLTELGFRVVKRSRQDGAPFITDNGNFILDCHDLPRQPPANIDNAIKSVAGVVETGLFAAIAEQAIIGFHDGRITVHDGQYPARAGVALEAAALTRLIQPRFVTPPILLVMGVSGAGKTTIGALIAAVLGLPFQDADELHPKANVEKMHRGEALNDADRLPWLQRVAAVAKAWRRAGQGGVIGCSALNRRYRDVIIGDDPAIIVLHLDGTKSTINERLSTRHGHFMPATLLDSQFDALEPPSPDENAMIVSIAPPPMQIVMHIIQDLSARL